jgi:hypothetical protein
VTDGEGVVAAPISPGVALVVSPGIGGGVGDTPASGLGDDKGEDEAAVWEASGGEPEAGAASLEAGGFSSAKTGGGLEVASAGRGIAGEDPVDDDSCGEGIGSPGRATSVARGGVLTFIESSGCGGAPVRAESPWGAGVRFELTAL